MSEEQEARSFDSRPDTYEHIGKVRANLSKVIRSLLHRAEVHDQSKLKEPEVSVFNEYTPKLAESTYGSDEYKSFLEGMKAGLDHHYAENDHHPEHFIDGSAPFSYFGDSEPASRFAREPLTGIQAMDLVQLIEMLCDWQAATQRHKDGDIRRSIEQNQERFGYGDELKQILLNSVEAVSDE